jgi:hypothetical protein
MALGAGEEEVEQLEAANAAVANLDGQLGGGTKGVRVHLASMPSGRMSNGSLKRSHIIGM